MQNSLNTQKSNFSDRTVLAHSEVTSARKSVPLGNKGKSCAKPLTKISKLSLKNNDVSKRNQAYRLQRISAETLANTSFREGKTPLVCSCCKRRNGSGKAITVNFNKSKNKASFGNLLRCDSVWTCPVCSKSISEYRRDELLTISEKWQKGDYFQFASALNNSIDMNNPDFVKQNSIFLVTFTIRHSRSESLKEILDALKHGLHCLTRNASGRKLLAKYGIAHNVRSLEVTYGNSNGWHPHYHVLFYSFFNLTPEQMEQFQKELAVLWKGYFKGEFKRFEPNLKNGVDVADGSFASTYINKFGEQIPCRRLGDKVDLEMTKSHMKKAKEKDRFTAFEMLEYFDDLPYLKPKFIEYARTFFGSKQLRYSRYLKRTIGLVDLDDKAVLDELEATEEVTELFNVHKTLFDLLYINDLRGEFLAMIEIDIKKGGFESDLKNTHRLIKTVIGNVINKLQKALDKTMADDLARIQRIQDRILSCINLLENPLVLEGSRGGISPAQGTI